MISALKVLVNYLKAQSEITDLVSTRIGVRHKYGSGWENDEASIVAKPSGGPTQLYVDDSQMSVDFRIYTSSAKGVGKISAIDEIYRALVTVARRTTRNVVTTEDGDGLLRTLNLQTAPIQLSDMELNDREYWLVVATILVAETAIA